jgi:hypothetical protein
MATVGIMHGGSNAVDGSNVGEFQKSLEKSLGVAVNYVGPLYAMDLNKSLENLADQLLDANLDILIAAGGSRSAEAASSRRALRSPPDTPTIVFTSVAPYVVNTLAKNMTGVCAHTSDHDAQRLRWLIEMPFKGKRIGVLENSARRDHKDQKKHLDDEVNGTAWHLVYRDIQIHKTLKDVFEYFKGDIHALVVAADPLFNETRKEVITRATSDKYPAIFQWREFV